MTTPTEPTTRHAAVYRQAADEAVQDGRLHSPTFDRNAAPVADVLTQLLGDAKGTALEIGSGSGRHICHFAMHLPGLHFVPSDPDRLHRESVAAWARETGASIATALAIDASTDWPTLPEVKHHGPFRLILSMNVVHIAPFAVAEGLIAGAATSLTPDGLLVLYGPFMENGTHTGDGNATFDARLRADNPEWGLRDIGDLTELARAAGLAAPKVIPMPANNRILAFSRA